jgi:hypothetical protein
MGELKPHTPIEDFGRGLLLSGDLDPIYVLLEKADLSEEERDLLCLAYWCFYHIGTAAWVVDSTFKGSRYFWDYMETAAINKPNRFPRNPERRHFRGDKCVAAIWAMKDMSPTPNPRSLIHLWAGEGLPFWYPEGVSVGQDYPSVAKRVQRTPQFGPWIAFKVADMMERCLGKSIDFKGCNLSMYREPIEGARRLAAMKMWNVDPEDDKALVDTAVDYLLDHFANYLAPPKADRLVGLQEIETILCKWKSHTNGHYQVGHDIKALRKDVLFSDGPVARELRDAYEEAFPDA